MTWLLLLALAAPLPAPKAHHDAAITPGLYEAKFDGDPNGCALELHPDGRFPYDGGRGVWRYTKYTGGSKRFVMQWPETGGWVRDRDYKVTYNPTTKWWHGVTDHGRTEIILRRIK